MTTPRQLYLACAAALVASSLSGCTTIVRGGPASTQEGVHYFLPMTVVRVTPNADGTMTVKTESIPDRRHEYVVSASSIFGKYTFEAKVNQGLLTELNMDADSTDVAKAAVEAAGEIEKARVTAERKAVEARETAATARETAIKDASKLVLDKKRALEKLREKRAELRRQGLAESADEIKTVDLEIVAAQKDLAFAEEDLAALLGGKSGSNFDDPGAQRVVGSGAWGPVVYRVEQFEAGGSPSVKLVQAGWTRGTESRASQIEFRTATTAIAAATPAAAKAKLEIVEKNAKALADGTRVVTVTSHVKIVSVNAGEILQGPLLEKVADASVSLAGGAAQQGVEARIPATVPAGTYFLRFKYKSTDAAETTTEALEFVLK